MGEGGFPKKTIDHLKEEEKLDKIAFIHHCILLAYHLVEDSQG